MSENIKSINALLEIVNDFKNKNLNLLKISLLETNKIIVYDTMKKTYSKLNITLEKLRNIINNKEIINDCKYEFY